MTPEEFAAVFKKLLPDTTMTPEHLLAALPILNAAEQNYEEWSGEKLINQKVLSEWIDETESNLEKLRKRGEGPQITYKNKKVAYMVKDVRDWLYSNQYQSPAEHRDGKRKELLESMGLRAFFGMEFDTVFPTIYIDYQPRPFFESIDEELNITGYEVLWAEKDSLTSWYLSVCELGIDIDAIISELEKRVNDGLDINAPQSFIKNNEAYSACFSHIIAKQKMESFQEYALLINTLFKLNVDFTQTNSNGETAIDLAKQCGNENLVKMIESKALFDKLNEMLPAK